MNNLKQEMVHLKRRLNFVKCDDESREWLQKILVKEIQKGMRCPYIYFIPDGSVSLQWDIKSKSIELDIDVKGINKMGYWNEFDLKTHDNKNRDIPCLEEESWKYIRERLSYG